MPKKTNLLEDPHGFSISLVLNGLLVGLAAGGIAIFYRLMLNYAENALFAVIDFTKGNGLLMTVWFLLLILMGILVGRLVAWEGMSSGSGIPQVQGEMKGYLNQNWLRILISKIIGGTLCILGGLSLGREGPSVQLGAMAAKGAAKLTGTTPTKERYMLTCGAGAGLAAAFNAPLAGVMFSLEELQKNFNSSMLVCVISGCAVSDFLSKHFFGLLPVFDFHLHSALPLNNYWLLVLLGLLLGVLGAFYNFVMLKGQDLFNALKMIPPQYRIILPFLLSGIVCYTMPQILAGGHAMIGLLDGQRPAVAVMLMLLIGKFLFSAFCFGSGAPGGIFFPMLVLGAYIGAVFGTVVIDQTGLEPFYMVNFITIAMAGFFTAIVRAPITGILLIAEMTGTFEHFLSLAVVCLISYMTAHLLKSEPIYESLLGRILAKNGLEENEGPEHKILRSFSVGAGSMACGQKIRDIQWPDHCLIVTLQRGEEEIIARGSTIIHPGDTVTALVDENYLGMVTESIQLICGEIQMP
nr:ClC family H(+)/Cl(-) exchange transporter [uncultured Anaerostipes sp.]